MCCLLLLSLSRAYHHLRLSRLCVPLYLRCLSILGGGSDASETPERPVGPPGPPGGPVAGSLALPSPTPDGQTAEDPTLRQEWSQLRMVRHADICVYRCFHMIYFYKTPTYLRIFILMSYIYNSSMMRIVP